MRRKRNDGFGTDVRFLLEGGEAVLAQADGDGILRPTEGGVRAEVGTGLRAERRVEELNAILPLLREGEAAEEAFGLTIDAAILRLRSSER